MELNYEFGFLEKDCLLVSRELVRPWRLAALAVGLDSFIIVSQPDHVRRAVFTARGFGCDAFGYAAKDVNGRYSMDSLSGGILDHIPMLRYMEKSSAGTLKDALSTLESIGSVAPNTDTGICAHLVVQTVTSSASRLRNMIKTIF